MEKLLRKGEDDCTNGNKAKRMTGESKIALREHLLLSTSFLFLFADSSSNVDK